MRKRLALSFWLLGILFPAAWLGRYSAVYQAAFKRVFSPEWAHVFMHGLLYAVLALLLLAVWGRGDGLRPVPLGRSLVGIGVLIAAVGFVQESLQWISQGTLPWQGLALSASLYDLGIDLGGGFLGIGVERLWRLRHRC